jgi:hypothetical protein
MTTLNEGSAPAELIDQRDTAPDGDVQGRNIQGRSVQGLNVQRPNAQGSNAQGPKVQEPKVQGPMSQQAAFGSHGYDIYPQTFVRLVGCHQSNAAKYQAALRTAA